ncbi:CHAD domain-containing protein [Draconibacterium sp. IB214405]|uniref:CHAD domain-containing protein n=1 Tax=Draconibacterium sp. IB214405 TaxID=3097352 RepID=UPI002A0D0F85|nr:CHAD domain-containing protein [Draconibacterium sp. IB214405]MDX8340596.1 CHAD domain-containing protein [Draconibacterium sp. IB214405]
MSEDFSLEIKEREYFEEGIFRVLDKLHSDSAKFITSTKRQHYYIHEVRTNIKKIRGLLRLLRHEIGEESYNEMNAYYRDLAMEVAPLRDDTSQIELLQEVKSKLRNPAVTKALDKIISQHRRNRKTAFDHFKETGHAENIKQMILSLQQMIHSLSFTGDPEFFILKSLQHIYKRARGAFETTEFLNDEEVYHYWRKQVKYLTYHLMLLNKAWPNSIHAYISDLSLLGSTLGKLHDLDLFHAAIKSKRIVITDKDSREKLMRYLYNRRSILRKRVQALGEQCFAESSDAFALRIFNNWENSVMHKKQLKLFSGRKQKKATECDCGND